MFKTHPWKLLYVFLAKSRVQSACMHGGVRERLLHLWLPCIQRNMAGNYRRGVQVWLTTGKLVWPLRSSWEKDWVGHWLFAAKVIGSLFALFQVWRCDIVYDHWRAQVLLEPQQQTDMNYASIYLFFRFVSWQHYHWSPSRPCCLQPILLVNIESRKGDLLDQADCPWSWKNLESTWQLLILLLNRSYLYWSLVCIHRCSVW